MFFFKNEPITGLLWIFIKGTLPILLDANFIHFFNIKPFHAIKSILFMRPVCQLLLLFVSQLRVTDLALFFFTVFRQYVQHQPSNMPAVVDSFSNIIGFYYLHRPTLIPSPTPTRLMTLKAEVCRTCLQLRLGFPSTCERWHPAYSRRPSIISTDCLMTHNTRGMSLSSIVPMPSLVWNMSNDSEYQRYVVNILVPTSIWLHLHLLNFWL